LIRVRETLGQEQAKIHTETDTKLEEKISKAVAKKEEAAKRDEELRHAKKKKQHNDLKTYFIEFVRCPYSSAKLLFCMRLT
jgi:hypothetical protein